MRQKTWLDCVWVVWHMSLWRGGEQVVKSFSMERISDPGRFEYRSVDSMVNPYLMAAALLKAFDHGIKGNLDPGEPEQGNLYKAIEAGKQVKKLPMSLGEALDCLAADDVIQSALPEDMYMVYTAYKRDEWERFMATVSNWDVENYLDCLP